MSSDDGEQEALERIRKYLDAGHSIEAIRQAGWAEWLDYFESKGVSVVQDSESPETGSRFNQPEEQTLPDATTPSGVDSKFTMMLSGLYIGRQVETKGIFSKRKFVRLGPLITTGAFLFETGAVLGRAMRDRLPTFAYPFCSATPENVELADFMRRQGQAVASAAPEATTIFELIVISEMRKAEPNRSGEQWNEWFFANGDSELTVDFAGQMGALFQSGGAGYGAEFPEKFEQLFASSYKVDDPELWREAAKAGLDVPPEPPDFDTLETRTKNDLAMFAEYCAEFYPDYVKKLGLGDFVTKA